MNKDYDTEEQCNAFDEWTKLTADFYDRQRHHTGAVGYDEIEWEAFQEGWNAAKKHFRNEEILNIKAGADINAGDGGYSIGTQEKYDEFVRKRNMSMNKTNPGLTIPFEVADGIVLASMKEQHSYLKQELKDHLEKGSWMHPEDFYNSTVNIIPALEILIKYYGGSVDTENE